MQKIDEKDKEYLASLSKKDKHIRSLIDNLVQSLTTFAEEQENQKFELNVALSKIVELEQDL